MMVLELEEMMGRHIKSLEDVYIHPNDEYLFKNTTKEKMVLFF